MKITSAEAAKLLKKMNTDLESVRNKELLSKVFTVSAGENEKELRPAYDYAETREQINELEDKIRRLKHAINLFNVSTPVPGFDMTIDQMLVYLPQLNLKKSKLLDMKDALPRTRLTRINSNLVEYELVNYDFEAVKADYEAVSDTLARAQNALDIVNTTLSFEVEL